MYKWVIDDHILRLKNEDNHQITPLAKDIFYYVFGGTIPDGYHIPDDVENNLELLGLSFSKITVNPQLKLKAENEEVRYELFFIKQNKKYRINLPEFDGCDHYIVDNRWHYINSNYWVIADLFKSLNIDDDSRLSFSTYVKLLNRLQKSEIDFKIDDTTAEDLKTSIGDQNINVSDTLNATLYPYQEIGYKWLSYVTNEDFGCILGDEMGLGKTLQVIALLLDRKYKKEAPQLVVAPVSLLENWKREIQKFAPSLKVHVNHGQKRYAYYAELLNFDVIVISYSSTISDLSMLQMINWDILVLDEAQNIKNPYARRTEFTKMIPHRAAIAVTGTPFENHMTDLWSLLDFTMPGLMGSLNEFNTIYTDDAEGATRIEPILSAVMLRRKVDEVAKDLPEKVIIDQAINMEPQEAYIYDELRKEAIASKNILGYITRFRMLCTHPLVLNPSLRNEYSLEQSNKYSRFIELISEILWNNEKAIVFTSFNEMNDIIVQDLKKRFGINVYSINGGTPIADRQSIVDKFNGSVNACVLVLNPKAAGVGLNITGANHVIHYNLEWNPAIEDQATARAYRRGQEKTVFVYRLFYANTLEQMVNEKIIKKREMTDLAVIGTDGIEYSKEEILEALSHSPIG